MLHHHNNMDSLKRKILQPLSLASFIKQPDKSHCHNCNNHYNSIERVKSHKIRLDKMAPKKRGRKIAKVIPPETKLVVPPKKRKTFPPPVNETPSEDNLVPEWVKVSIQILLINFHQDGVALLNSIQTEYEAVYQKYKIHPKTYDFQDWESMLKSPQFKKHFFVYTDKKIPYIKGYPLPRTAGICMKDGKWEIDPKIEIKNVPPSPEEKLERTTSKFEFPPSNATDLQALISPKPSLSLELATVVINPSKEKLEEGTRKILPSPSNANNIQNIPNPTSPPLRIEIPPTIRTPTQELSPITPESLLEIDADDEYPIEIPQTKRTTVTSSYANHHRGNKTSYTRDNYRTLRYQGSYDDAGFFRRSELPSTWTNTKFGEEKNDFYSNSDSNSDEDVKLIIDENPNRQNNNRQSQSHLNSNNLASSTSTSSRSQTPRFSPPPPQLVRMDIDIDLEENNRKDLRNTSMRNGNETFVRNALLSMMPKQSQNSTNTTLEIDNNLQNNNGSDVDINAKFIRRISDSTDESCTEISSVQNSPENPDKKIKSKEKSSSKAIDSGVTLHPWKLTCVHVDQVKVQNETDHCNIFTPPPFGINKETILGQDKDPRLTSGLRSRWFLKQEQEDFVEVKSENEMKSENGSVKRGSQSSIDSLGDIGDDPSSQISLEDYQTQSFSEKSGNQIVAGISAENSVGDKNRPEFAMKPLPSEPNLTITIRLDQDHRKIETQRLPIGNTINTDPVSTTPTTNNKEAHDIQLPKPKPFYDNSKTSASASPRINYSHADSPTPSNSSSVSSVPSTPLKYNTKTKILFGLKNPIPHDKIESKSIKCSDLWKDIKWKNRFDEDGGRPNRFFQSNIFERWRQAFTRELPHHRQALVLELQKYEEKPYPSRCEFYLRSSLRMVEIDYLTDDQFSQPRLKSGENLVAPGEILYYVDFAGAPGGVIEFYQKRRKWATKGFGVTYQKRSYDLHIIPDVEPEYFEAFYGKLNSLNGDGSLFCSDTVNLFINRVMEATGGKGVHIVTTIGNVARVAFEDNNDEKWKYQHLAQIMVALMMLREGGNMAFKMYDLKSSFTVGLVYLLYRCFEQVQISKLHIFAPASGEKVILCVGKKSTEEIAEILKYLQECHKVMADWYLRDKFNKHKMTIEELVPYDTLDSYKEFMAYIRECNESLKRQQLEEFTISLKNVKALGCIFSKGLYRNLVSKTTEIWNVGDRPQFRDMPPRNAIAAFKDLRVYPEDVCEAVETILNEYNLYTIFASAQHWKFVPVANQLKPTRGFYLSFEGMPYFFNTKYKEWILVRDYEFRLPSRTLVYGQIVSVFSEDKTQMDEYFSIIDGMALAGKEIRNLPYNQRIKECEKFCDATTRIFFPRMIRLTVTKAYDFAQLPEFLEKIESFKSTETGESSGSTSIISTDLKTTSLVLPTQSVLKERVSSVFKQMYCNPSGVLFFEADNGTKPTDFCSSVFSRVYWEWVSEMDLPVVKPSGLATSNLNILTGDEERPIGSVSAKKLIDFVNRYS